MVFGWNFNFGKPSLFAEFVPMRTTKLSNAFNIFGVKVFGEAGFESQIEYFNYKKFFFFWNSNISCVKIFNYKYWNNF